MARKTQILVFCLCAIVVLFPLPPSAQTQSDPGPSPATKARLQPIVKGILAAWDKFDVVCLGEDHGSKNDSDLRIALIEDPDFYLIKGSIACPSWISRARESAASTCGVRFSSPKCKRNSDCLNNFSGWLRAPHINSVRPLACNRSARFSNS